MDILRDKIDAFFDDKIISNIALRVVKGDEVLVDIYKSDETEIDENTIFDMASVTKILSTTSLALIALDRRLFSLDDKVSRFYNTDKSITIFNLLTHTIGIGYKPLYDMNVTSDNVADVILSIPSDFEVGSEVRYSCPGFILLGKILEKVFGDTLDNLFLNLVALPLGMSSTSYLPKKTGKFINPNTDIEAGIVNDYNCRCLGGVAGNAGVFSTMSDMTKYARMLTLSGHPIIKKETFEKAVKNYTPQMSESRGLGFLYVDERYMQTGSLFKEGSFGHCGHTGQSVFVNAQSGLAVIILTDATKKVYEKFSSHEHYNVVMNMRRELHEAIRKYLK